jgi:HD-GYP domain-containing protein (c-di-GMP phosphodiesterase class II)
MASTANHDTDRLEQLVELVRSIGAERDLDTLLVKLMGAVTREVDADRSSLFLYDAETDELWSKVAQGLDSEEIRFPAGTGLAGHTARTGEVVNIADAYEDERFNQSIDRKTGYRTRQVLCVPLRRRDGEVIGLVQALNKKDDQPFGDEDVRRLETLAGLAAVAVENALLHEENEQLFENTVLTTAQAIEERDPATSGHVWRVASYSVNLAKAVHQRPDDFGQVYDRDRLRQLRYAGLLHDVGKIGVREAVLSKARKIDGLGLPLIAERLRRLAAENGAGFEGSEFQQAGKLVERINEPRPMSDDDRAALEGIHDKHWIDDGEFEALSIPKGTLTREEWEDMRSHPDRSFRVLTLIKWPRRLSQVPEIARDHHEKLTGDGYTRGLSEDQIPFDARIVAVADVYDALTANDRPYKPAIPHDRARKILESMASERAVDPRLVDLFFEAGCFELAEDKPEEVNV